MATFRVNKNKENPFVMISNEMLKDERMSWKAKGLLSYLLSNEDKWQIYETELVKHSTDGRTSLRSAIQELMELGYIERKRLRDSYGKFKGYEYLVYEQSIHITKPDNGKPNVGKRDTNNINNNNTNSNYNKDLLVSEDNYIYFDDIDDAVSKLNTKLQTNRHKIRSDNYEYVRSELSKVYLTDDLVGRYMQDHKQGNRSLEHFVKVMHRYLNE